VSKATSRFRHPLIAAGILLLSAITAFAANPIQTENAKPGTTAWQVTNPATAAGQIEGFASAASVPRGGQISFYVNTTDPSYTLQVFRTGWYNGTGARQMTSAVTLPGIKQPIPSLDPTTGMAECNWSNPYVLSIPNDTSDPTDWASGVYLALLTGTSSGLQSYIVFTVRDDSRTSNYLFINSTNTYHAYNGWGGKSLYSYNSSNSVPAVKVSYNRPYDANYGTGKYLLLEYEMVRFLEREGYDITYATDVDMHENGSLLLNHNGILVVGHGEYYSWQMRSNMIAARDAGVNIGLFAANDCYWQVRYEPSVVNGAADRTLVGYKEVALTEDPYYLGGNTALYPYVTTNWRSAPVNLPEDDWEGVIYEWGSGISGDIVISDASSWVWANTGVANGTHIVGILGDEVDDLGTEAPAGTQTVALSPWSSPGNGSGTSAMTWYTAPSGATVFAAGSIHWVWGVDSWRMPGSGDPSTVSAVAQQATRNVLARFVTNAAPTNTALPIITGTAQQGSVLSTSNGSWTGNPTSYTYSWARCDSSGLNCTAIATTTTYPLTSADVGFTIRATVTATNATGSNSAASLPTGIVQSLTPSVTTETLPVGSLNASYSATLAASGGTTPYSWSLINSTTLPTGLQLNASTGAITGTPTTTGITNFTVQVTDHNSQTATKALSITVNSFSAPARVQAASVEGSAVSSVSVAFPVGNTAANLIVAFVRASTTTQTITLSDSAGNTYSQAVNQAQTTDGHQIAIFYAPNIKAGANTVTATFSASNNHPFLAIYEYSGLSTTNPLDRTAAAQGTTAAASSGATATTTAANELVFAGLGLPSSSTTTVTAGSGFALEQQDTRSTGSRAASEDQLVSATGTYAGSFTLGAADNWSAVVATFLPPSAPPAPTVSTTSLPAGTQNAAYSASLAATGGSSPYSWSLINGTTLPASLQLNSSTGAITGSPSAIGTTNFTVQVIDNNSNTATKALSIPVNPPPSITTTALANGSPNVGYSAALAASGGTPPLTWSISTGSLPIGLQLNTSTGAISGTPTAGGTADFTAQVTDANGATNSAALSITINPTPLSITTTALSNAALGVPYSTTLQATGGTTICGVYETCAGGNTPYFWSLINGTTLPAGLQLNSSTGVITGTPTATGTTNFTAQVTDSGLPTPQTVSKPLSITVNSFSAPARVQAASIEGSAVTSVSIAFPASNTAGNLIIAFVRASTTTQTITLSDSAGNSYSQAVSQAQTTDGHQTAIFYAPNIKAGANTVTATFSASNNHPFLGIYEYSGLSTTNPLDKTAAAQGTTAAASSGATATTTVANELVFAGLGLPSISATTVTAGSGYTLEQQDTRSGGSRAASEDQTVSATGTYAGAFTLSAADNWSAVVATFLPPSAPPALTVNTNSLSAGTQNAAYTATLSASGGTAPYSWTLINSTTLPAGLQLNSSTGAITGTPTATGITNFTVQVTDNNSKTATKALSITVNSFSAPARVQAASIEGSAVSSVSVAFPASNTAGNLIIAFVRASTTTQTITLSDTAGNTYSQAITQAQTTDGHQIAIFYAPTIKPGANTVTATFSASNNHPYLAIYEYNGLSTLDKTAGAQGTTAAASSGATVTTTAATELVFAGLGLPSSATTTVTAGSGFTLEQQDTNSGGSRAASEDETVSATGAYSGTFTLSSSTNWSCVTATFK
jgi:methionine-rich copper-binding protein CopC